MAYQKRYEIYERSEDGLLKEPVFKEPYGYTSSFCGLYKTEEEAIKAICERQEKYRDFLVVPVVRYVEE